MPSRPASPAGGSALPSAQGTPVKLRPSAQGAPENLPRPSKLNTTPSEASSVTASAITSAITSPFTSPRRAAASGPASGAASGAASGPISNPITAVGSGGGSGGNSPDRTIAPETNRNASSNTGLAKLVNRLRGLSLGEGAEEAGGGAGGAEGAEGVASQGEDIFDREELMITDEELYFVEVLEAYTETPDEVSNEEREKALNYFKDEQFDAFRRYVGLLTGPNENFSKLWKGFDDYDTFGFTQLLATIDSDSIVSAFIQLIDEVPSAIYDIKILNNLNMVLQTKDAALLPKHNKCPSVEIFDTDINYYHMFKLIEIISAEE